jgi:pilus assembly protein CpaE
MMPERRAVIMISSAAEVSSNVAAALQAGTQFELTDVFDDFAALKARLDRGDVQAALLDIDGHGQQLLSALVSASARFPEVRFLILTSRLGQDLLIEAMQAGARHVLEKSSIATRLDSVLRRLVPDSAQRTAGRITTLLSASGGCGSTTLAMNLANELQLVSGEPALLVDMDMHFGAVSVWLGINAQFGLRDVLSFAEGVDSHLVRSTAQTVSDNLHVLLNPPHNQHASTAEVSYKRLDEALDACRFAYANTIVDAPRVPLQVAVRLGLASAMTLIVMQLTVRDIHVARNLAADLIADGLPHDQILLLVNRHCKRSLISLEEARRALNNLPLLCVSNDYRSAAKAMNHGKMLAVAAASSPLRRDLAKLAARLYGSHQLSQDRKGRR